MTDGLEILDPNTEIERALTSAEAVELLTQRLTAARFQFEPEDQMVLATAAEFTRVADEGDYTRGYEIIAELSDLERRINAHYVRFKDPINKIVNVVRGLASEDVNKITGAAKGQLSLKQRISQLVGRWKADKDAEDRRQQVLLQQVRDQAAQDAQMQRVDTLTRVAAAEPDPAMREVFTREADQMAAVTVKASPVTVQQSAPKVTGGHVKVTWKAEVFDLKALLQAYLDGKCFLDETAIIAGLQSQLNDQAASLQKNLERAYPGCRGVDTHSAVTRRPTGGR